LKRIFVLGAILIAAVGAGALRAQQQPAGPAAPGGAGPGRAGGRGFAFPPVTAAEKVADNLYMIAGQGGNTAAWIMENGVLLVDTKLVNNGQAILDELKKVTDKPVTHIVNTHSHADHNGSNAFFPPTVEIVAQEKGIPRVQEQFKDARQGIPDRGYKDRLSLFRGKERVDLYHFGAAHTDNDTFVVFREARVMHTGDTFASKAPPFIDRDSGGSGIAFPATLGRATREVKDVERVITGHAAVLPWQDFVDWAEYNSLFFAHANASMKAGKPAEQAAKEFAPGEKFKGYGAVAGGRGGAAGNFGIIYEELKTAK
jgi:glyoxylase-like metal-dependent hydrolase (beta-lactamase superfamily II)